MKNLALSIFVLLLIPFCAKSQVSVSSSALTSGSILEFVSNPGQNLIANPCLDPGIEGSPYLIEDWQQGYIIMKTGDTIPSIKLRYNVYKDEMHFMVDEKVYSIGIPDRIKILVLGDSPYFYFSYKEDNEIKKGFFEVLSLGKSCILKHYYYGIVQPNYNPILNTGSKMKQLVLKKKYFLKTKDNDIIEIDKKGEQFFSAFGSNGNIIKQYSKDNDLSFKEESDLIAIVSFANSLK